MVFVLITSVQSFLSDDWRRPELTIFCGFFCPGRRRDIYRQEVLQESGPQSFRKNVRSVGTVERCLACEAVVSMAMSFRNVLRVQRSIVR
jgi:hypothetical protein